MEIKKIVEGMTATEVAQVIDDNFKAAEAEKANKTDVNASIFKLTETVESNKTETDAKIDRNKEETDGKLSGLGSYIENPEYARAYTDAEGRFLWGIKKDGSIEWAKGVPTPVKKYIESLDIENDQEVERINQLVIGLLADVKMLTDTYHYVSNPEWACAIVDSEERILMGIKTDGSYYVPNRELLEVYNDVEGRTEMTLDAEGKILAYRDKEGVKHEDKFSVNDMTFKGVVNFEGTSIQYFINSLKDYGVLESNNDWSNKKTLQIPIPRCSIINISGVESMPISKNQNLKAYIEVWDLSGNYFKKKIILNAQGTSSLGMPKKNFAVDLCNDEWVGDDTFELKLGDWVPQDSFHFKSYYADYFRGIAVVGYKLYDQMLLTRDVADDRTWKRALLPSISTNTKDMEGYDDSLSLDNGARCYPDGFPCVVYLNNAFYGVFSWQLKKHRDNYNMSKKEARHIHLDGNISNVLLWEADGVINWNKWNGIIQESEESTSTEGLEIRNPKNLIGIDGSEYEFETNAVELIGYDSALFDSTNKDMVRTAEVKKYITDATLIITKIREAIASFDSESEIKSIIEKYLDVDSIIDYLIFSDVTANFDGFKKNWQWTTYDGIKWSVNPYDLDGILGWSGWGEIPPSVDRYGNNEGYPTYYIIKYYTKELEERYAYLRDNKIIDTKNIYNILKDWVSRFGAKSLKLDHENWPYDEDHYSASPIGGHVDNIYRVFRWVDERIKRTDVIYNYNK